MKKITTLLCCCLLLSACGADEDLQASPTLNPAEAPAPAGEPNPDLAPDPQEILQEGAPHSGSGIENHTVNISFSDSLVFERGTEITTAGSVPEAIVIEDEIFIYFVDGTAAHQGDGKNIYYITSDDGGETWTEREAIEIDGLPAGLEPVDPSMHETEDGEYRMFFYDFPINKKQESYKIYSAISTDGVEFEMEEGLRIELEINMTDPEVVYLDGTWYMYFAGGEEKGISLATSEDGLNFEYVDSIHDGLYMGIPGAIVEDDTIYLYDCSKVGASKNGIEFEVVEENAMQGCDPSPIKWGDRFIMVYKDFIQEEPPQN